MADFLRHRQALGRSIHRLVRFFPLLLLLAACISRPFIFKKNPDTRLPSLNGGIVVSAKNDSRTVHGFFVKQGPDLIVLFHGQASTMARETIFGRVFAGNGFSVLLVEYAGYGLAKKESPSESAIYDDSETLIANIQEQYNLSAAKTVFWGRSLGSGVAAEMVLRKRGRAAILVTPYTSIAAVAENKTIPVLPRLFVWDNFNTGSKAAEIEAPVLLIGAGRDTLTPVKMTHDLAAKFPHAEEMILPNATHFNVHAHLSGAHWQKIIHFARH
jgi:uncharacterized protein